MVKDSGKRETASTGAVRDSREGKGRFDLIPPEVETVLARVLEEGAKKYAERNWEKGMPFSRVFDSLRRHLNQWQAGQDDEDHLGHALANLVFLVTFRERVRAGKLDASLADIGPVIRSYPGQEAFRQLFPDTEVVDSLEPVAFDPMGHYYTEYGGEA